MERPLGEIVGYTEFGLPAVNVKPIQEYREQGPVDVVSVYKKGSEIDVYGLSDGSYIYRDMAVRLANEGLLNGCIVSTSRLGERYIKNSPDSDSSNNLQNLPRIK